MDQKTMRALSRELTPRVESLQSANEAQLYALLIPTIGAPTGGAAKGTGQRVFPPALIGLGKNIFRRWSRAFHQFLCAPNSDDKDTQQKLMSLIVGGGRDATVITTVAAALVSLFALSTPVASVVAVLLFRLVFTPAGEELCEFWTKSLGDEPKDESKTKPAKKRTAKKRVKKAAAT